MGVAGGDKLVTVHVTAQVHLRLCWMDARVSGALGGGIPPGYWKQTAKPHIQSNARGVDVRKIKCVNKVDDENKVMNFMGK